MCALIHVDGDCHCSTYCIQLYRVNIHVIVFFISAGLISSQSAGMFTREQSTNINDVIVACLNSWTWMHLRK